MENIYLKYASLQYENKALRKELDSFRNGRRYRKLQEDHRLIIKGYIKEIKHLRRELADAHSETVSVRNIWFEECDRDWEKYQSEMAKKDREIQRLNDRIWGLLKENDDRLSAVTEDYERRLGESEAVISELKSKLAHAEALLDRDGTNTSTPTSQTPPGKKKHIPNSRRNSGKPKGGQAGHEKHTLEKPPADEVNEEEDHLIGSEGKCPKCGSEKLYYTGEHEDKYEYDIQIKVIKKLHRYWTYECADCGRTVTADVDPQLRGECQYGPGVQALALSLMNTTNAAINKVPVLLSGLTDAELHPCEGYIAKLQPRASTALAQFKEDLFMLLITRQLIYWDDTVIMVDRRRACLRFYGDETIAYYVAHDKKDMNGILEDGVLEALTEMTKVMHDNNSINYNPRFVFTNLECNAHIQRDLQKSTDETGHGVLLEIKGLISRTIKERNDLVAAGVGAFEAAYVEKFNNRMAALLDKAAEAAKGNTSIYSGPFERSLVARIKKYFNNIFAWVKDFTLPTTNNLAERALRGVKTKQKVSGQFSSAKTAGYYATIRTYIETCRRNGLNEMKALIKLCSGNPYTVQEIFNQSPA